MARAVRILELTVSVFLLPAAGMAQAPPPTQVPIAPKNEHLDTGDCAHSDAQTTVGKGGDVVDAQQDKTGNLSDRLARSGGVICPPEHVDPEIRQPTPPGGAMPVIPPPGAPVVTSLFSRSDRLLDSVCRDFLYRARSGALYRNGGVAQLVRAAES